MTRAYSLYVLAILFFVYVINQWCQYILNYLYNVSVVRIADNDRDRVSLAYATGVTFREYSLLSGIYYTLVYSGMSVIAGRVADVSNRKVVVFAAVLCISVAVLSLGFSREFLHVLMSRILLGCGQAFSTPACYSLIGSYFDSSQLSRANGVFSFGVYVGGGLSSLSVAVDYLVGWRETCWIVASLGLGVALLVVVTVREPPRTSSKGQKPLEPLGIGTVDPAFPQFSPSTKTRRIVEFPSSALVLLPNAEEAADLSVVVAPLDTNYTLWEAVTTVLGIPAVRWLLLASAIRFTGGYTIAAFVPTFYSRVYPEYQKTYSIVNAFVVCIGGATSAFMGGYVADRWVKHEPRARVWVPAIGALAAIPFMAGCVFVPRLGGWGFYLSQLFLFFEYLCAECLFGPVIAQLQECVPKQTQGFATSLFVACTTITGSLAPFVIDMFDKAFARPNMKKGTVDDIDAIRYEVFIAVALSYVTAAVLYVVTGSRIRACLSNQYRRTRSDSTVDMSF